MTGQTPFTIIGLAAALFLGACATQPQPIYAEPTFDKFGNPSCRPGDVPVGGVYTADLPICAVTYTDGTVIADAKSERSDPTNDTTPTDPDTPGDTTQDQSRDRDQSRDQSRDQEQSGNQAGNQGNS